MEVPKTSPSWRVTLATRKVKQWLSRLHFKEWMTVAPERRGINEISSVTLQLLRLSGIQGHGSRRESRQNPADAFIWSESFTDTSARNAFRLEYAGQGKTAQRIPKNYRVHPWVSSRWVKSTRIRLMQCTCIRPTDGDGLCAVFSCSVISGSLWPHGW